MAKSYKYFRFGDSSGILRKSNLGQWGMIGKHWDNGQKKWVDVSQRSFSASKIVPITYAAAMDLMGLPVRKVNKKVQAPIFKVGDWVECVIDTNTLNGNMNGNTWGEKSPLTKGKNYQIRNISNTDLMLEKDDNTVLPWSYSKTRFIPATAPSTTTATTITTPKIILGAKFKVGDIVANSVAKYRVTKVVDANRVDVTAFAWLDAAKIFPNEIEYKNTAACLLTLVLPTDTPAPLFYNFFIEKATEYRHGYSLYRQTPEMKILEKIDMYITRRDVKFTWFKNYTNLKCLIPISKDVAEILLSDIAKRLEISSIDTTSELTIQP